MRWHRGIIIAVLHLAVALPLIIYEDWQHIGYIRDARQRTSMLRPVAFQEGTVEWNPENIDYWVTKPETVVRLTNVPASIISGWHFPPHSRYTVAGLADRIFGRVSIQGTIFTSAGMVILISMQWLLIAARPVVTPRRSWLEPSVLILICGATSFALTLVPITREAYFIPLLIALLTWFVWLGLLIVRATILGWRQLRGRTRQQESHT